MDMRIFCGWLTENGLDLLQSIGIVGGLFFTARSLRLNSATALISFRHQLMLSHRELWDRYADSKDLVRILEPVADLTAHPVTAKERQFCISIINHIAFCHKANQLGFNNLSPNDLHDIYLAISKPITRSVWNDIKACYENSFVDFVDQTILSKGDLGH